MLSHNIRATRPWGSDIVTSLQETFHSLAIFGADSLLDRPIRHYFSTARPGPEAVVQTLFSTSNIHPRDRFDYWHSLACKMIVDHVSRPECREAFEAELQWGTLGDLGLSTSISFRENGLTG